MIKGFFFDLDGTLVDTHHPNYEAYKKALADYGVVINFTEFKKTIGMQAKYFLPLLAPDMTTEEYAQISEHKAKYYEQFMHHSVLNKSLVSFMNYMKSSGYQIALVTTARTRNANAVLRHHKLIDIFDFIVTAEDVVKSKPSPEAYEQALSRSGLRAKEVIAFEDSMTGKQAAEAAGIQVIMIKDFLV